MLVIPIKMAVGKYFLFPDSHISLIDTPTYEAKNIRSILDKFSEVCDIDIVRYKHVSGIKRTIEIREVDQFMFSPFTLGRAWVDVDKCYIELSKYMDIVQFRSTLLHEYLHCMGYEHTIRRTGDLMSPVDSEITEENIEEYAKDLCKVMKWKIRLKN
jgi:hypothetical protein